tara:strand:+ start:1265 stop:1603 length:339 start_codon:yes stop_codon:yes gene_type:complete
MSQKIIINASFGRFALSRKAILRLKSRGFELDSMDSHNLDFKDIHPEGHGDLFGLDIPRDHPGLVKVVEELKDMANGFGAYLKIVEVPDGVEWTVEEEKGREWVAEKHRTWR